jgi:hypothetical protein
LFSAHLGYFDTNARGCGRMAGLEIQSWPRDFLDETVILLNDIIQVFHTQDCNSLFAP